MLHLLPVRRPAEKKVAPRLIGTKRDTGLVNPRKLHGWSYCFVQLPLPVMLLPFFVHVSMLVTLFEVK